MDNRNLYKGLGNPRRKLAARWGMKTKEVGSNG